ncbi:MAG: Denitrification system component NirT [Gammaproteobacteria bacterium]|nr:Denitrification system component NirT [Gammaproteobacteria bacterium]NCF82966.1 Denitrification system component NirT [Pseudomonadota bacterium]
MISLVQRSWQWFWRPSSKYTWGGIFLIGGVAGIIFWGGFNTFMEYTNTMQFCISCHEMEENVYLEYKETIHFKNRTGVRTICADCHVPKEWVPKLIRKIKASNELLHKVMGSINTKEKFEAKRLELAENVWAAMEANDSHECRNCHSFEAMDFKKQQSRPRKKHPKAKKQGKTCIDCHKGIAHKLPEGYEEEDS